MRPIPVECPKLGEKRDSSTENVIKGEKAEKFNLWELLLTGVN